jgi:hypothetical protein
VEEAGSAGIVELEPPEPVAEQAVSMAARAAATMAALTE